MPYDPQRHHRRSIRLKGYDYRQPGAYFVTICTQDRACLFGEVVDGEMRLNDAGRMVERWWRELNRKFPHIRTDVFVVMPNHIHGIIVIEPVKPVGADPRVCPDGEWDAPMGASRPDGPDAQRGAHAGVPRPGGSDDELGAHVGAPRPGGPDAHRGAHVGAPLPGGFDDELGAHAGVPRPGGPDAQRGAHIGAPLPGGSDAHRGAHIGAPLPGGSDDELGTHAGVPRPGGPDAHRGAHVGASLPEIVQWFKTMTTNEYIRGVKQSGWTPFRGRLWQRSYYEHIIRNEESLNRIRRYIAENPLRWHVDRENMNRTGIDPDEEHWFSTGGRWG